MPDIRHSIQITAKPETIYPRVATARGFREWWAEDVTEAGGAVELGFFNKATVYRLRLMLGRPTSQAEWLCQTGDEWNGTRIRFALQESKAATLLRFTHVGWRSETEYFVSCNTTWGELMYRLKAASEGKSRGPLFLVGELSY